MFKRIRTYFDNRRFLKKFRKTAQKFDNLTNNPLKFVPTAPTQTLYQIHADHKAEDALMFTGGNGEEIFKITFDGEAVWLKEDSYNEAAEMFLTYMTMNIENKAGIMQNRIEWENRITAALVSEAEKSPLGPQELTDVVRKCIMYDKLKGVKN